MRIIDDQALDAILHEQLKQQVFAFAPSSSRSQTKCCQQKVPESRFFGIILGCCHCQDRVTPPTHHSGFATGGAAEVAEKLSTATGKRIRYVNVAPEEAKRAQLAAGVPPFTADALAELFAERRKGKEEQVSPIIQTIFGWRTTRFDEFAMRNAAIFRGEQPAPKV